VLLQKYNAQIGVCGCWYVFLELPPDGCSLATEVLTVQCHRSICPWHLQNELPSFAGAIAVGSAVNKVERFLLEVGLPQGYPSGGIAVICFSDGLLLN